MQGSWINQAVYYQCMFLAEYAASTKISHPLGVSARGQADNAVVEQARREIAAGEAKLRQHRAALEAGADPAVIARWMTET